MTRFLMLLAAVALFVTSPASAQQRSAGEAFLTSVREDARSEIFDNLNNPGFTLINFKGANGEAAIHILVEERRDSFVRLFLRRGADANIKRRDGETALLLATQLQEVGIVEDLLRYGADPNVGNRLNETPLMFAVRMRNPRLIKVLVEKGADPDIVDNAAGLSARDYARRDTRNPEILAMLEADEEQEDKGEEMKLKFGPILR